MSPTSIYLLHYFHPASSWTKNMFHQIWWSVWSVIGLVSPLYHVFVTHPRFLSSFQLLVNKELFHQSSFYLTNIVSSVQLLFKKSYLHFSPGGNVPGGKCPRPHHENVINAQESVRKYAKIERQETDRWWPLGQEFLSRVCIGTSQVEGFPDAEPVRWHLVMWRFHQPLRQCLKVNLQAGRRYMLLF